METYQEKSVYWAISRVNRFSCYLYDLNSGEKTDVQK